VTQPWVINIFKSLKNGYLQRTLNRFPWPLNEIAYRYCVGSELSKARSAEFNFAAASAKKRLQKGLSDDDHDFMRFMMKHDADKG
jgi:hypothetical protein